MPDNTTVDTLLREADALYSRSDALAHGKWGEQAEKDAAPLARATVKWNGGKPTELTLKQNGNMYEVAVPSETLGTISFAKRTNLHP